MSNVVRNSRSRLALVVVVLAAAVVAGCEEEVMKSTGAPPPRRGAAVASASASASATTPTRVFTEADFTPSDRNRDPFRGYPELFVANTKDPVNIQQRVIADRFALDELKLVAIVTGSTNPRAMFVDPDGKGWIITVGQLIGRRELVKAGGAAGAEYDLNWKVDRIREGDVVFVRDNPGRANVPAATRVIALRPEGDAATRKRLARARTRSFRPRHHDDDARPRTSRCLASIERPLMTTTTTRPSEAHERAGARHRAGDGRVARRSCGDEASRCAREQLGPCQHPLSTIAKDSRRERE